MAKAEPPGRPAQLPPADVRRRALARAVDLGLAVAPLLLVPRGHPRAGALFSAALLLCADALFGPGRSLGKRLSGLRVVVLEPPGPCGNRQSMVRNAIFVLGLLPAVAGAPLPLTFAALACLTLVEAGVALRPLTRDLGQRRLGDLLAGTQVVDGSVAIGLRQPPSAETPRATAPLASRAARKTAPPAKEPRPCASP